MDKWKHQTGNKGKTNELKKECLMWLRKAEVEEKYNEQRIKVQILVREDKQEN